MEDFRWTGVPSRCVTITPVVQHADEAGRAGLDRRAEEGPCPLHRAHLLADDPNEATGAARHATSDDPMAAYSRDVAASTAFDDDMGFRHVHRVYLQCGVHSV